MLLNPSQISDLMKVMDRYTIAFIAHHIGTSMLSTDEISTLIAAGFNPADISDATSNVVQAFKFGLLSDAIGNSVAQKMNYDQFRSYVSSGRFIPLNARESATLEAIKMQMAAGIKIQSENMKSDLKTDLVHIEKGRAAIHSPEVLSAAEEVIRDRKSVAQLRGMLGKRTGQWDRNLARMADYVLHDAFNSGRVASIERKGTKVYFDVFYGACKNCVRLYLTGGVGSEPRIFTIEELRANGSNVGRKVNEWKATIGPIHPHCRCTANEVPEGYEWDESTQSFSKPKEFERKVQRRSRVTVTVNGNKTEI